MAMASTSVQKAVLSTPPQGEASGSGSGSLTPTGPSSGCMNRHRLNFDEVVDRSRSVLFKEGHLKRLKTLRKELDYLQETNWKYQPIESYIGQ